MLKIEEQPEIRFRSREGFCLASLRTARQLALAPASSSRHSQEVQDDEKKGDKDEEQGDE